MERYCALLLFIILVTGCDSDNSDNVAPALPTSFNGRVLLQETMEPIPNVQIAFGPATSNFPTPIPLPPVILFSDDGSFSVDFEADEDIDFFTIDIAFFIEGEVVVGGVDRSFLLCDSFEACLTIPPGEAYQFDILITDESQIEFN